MFKFLYPSKRMLPARSLSLLLVAASIASLTACNIIPGVRDRSGDYREVEVLPPITLPEDLSNTALDPLYVIPDPEDPDAELLTETPLPRPIDVRRREGVIIQNLGDRQWIVIDASPGRVWPLVRDFWSQLELAFDYENPSSGIMDTSWLEVESDLESRHKYRVMIEPGLHSGYSEIYVRHFQQLRSETIPVVVTWPEVSTTPEREGVIVEALSQYLADRNDVYQASSSSLLAGSIEAQSKANIIEADEGNWLELRIDFERAWVQVRQALEAAEVEIVTSNADEAFYNVRFAGIVEGDGPAGFFSRLVGGGNDEDQVLRDMNVWVLEEDEKAVKVTAEVLMTDEDEAAAALSTGLTERLLQEDMLQVISDNLN
ncbi:MAG: outer membrane protein assembly factor BamC [Pseudohongiellaceae bacterium]